MLDIQIQGIITKIQHYTQSNTQLNEEFLIKFQKFDPISTQTLQSEIHQLALDKDQALNLLEYANKKYENIVQSLSHA